MHNSGTTTWIANGGNGYTLNNNGGTAMGAVFATPLGEMSVRTGTEVYHSQFHCANNTGIPATFRLNSSSSVYFGATVSFTIVVAPQNNSSVVSLSVPASVTIGQSFQEQIGGDEKQWSQSVDLRRCEPIQSGIAEPTGQCDLGFQPGGIAFLADQCGTDH